MTASTKRGSVRFTDKLANDSSTALLALGWMTSMVKRVGSSARRVNRTLKLLAQAGLTILSAPEAAVMTRPADFAKLFPGSGGALYGRASHGWMAQFRRPSSRSSLPGLWLAGGSVHPGPGVPMAALSGRLAAAAIVGDLGSTRR